MSNLAALQQTWFSCTAHFFQSDVFSVFMQIKMVFLTVLVESTCSACLSLFMQFSCVVIVISLFRIITDDQLQTVTTLAARSALYSVYSVCVYTVLSFTVVQRWSSLSNALNWFMLGRQLCNFVHACANSPVSIKI